jgi:hypothetical protein
MIIEFLKKLLQIILSKKNLNEAPNEWWQTILALGLFILIIISGPRVPTTTGPVDNKTVQKPVGKEQEGIQKQGPQENPYKSSKFRDGRQPGRAYPIDPPFGKGEGKKAHLTPMDPETGIGKELQKKDK